MSIAMMLLLALLGRTGINENLYKEKGEKLVNTQQNKIDMWYGDVFYPKKYHADSFFYPSDAVYRGNIYNDNGQFIGDYTTNDSVWIENNFILNQT